MVNTVNISIEDYEQLKEYKTSFLKIKATTESSEDVCIIETQNLTYPYYRLTVSDKDKAFKELKLQIARLEAENYALRNRAVKKIKIWFWGTFIFPIIILASCTKTHEEPVIECYQCIVQTQDSFRTYDTCTAVPPVGNCKAYPRYTISEP